MADVLETKDYPAAMRDRKLNTAVTMHAVDITPDSENPTYSLYVYYGMNVAEEVVVQIAKEVVLNDPIGCSILPLVTYDDGRQLPDEINAFLQGSGFTPQMVARLIRENAP